LSGGKVKAYSISSLLQDWKQKLKTHHYQASGRGVDFFLEESSDNSKEFYMTSHKSRVKKTDLIKIHGSSGSQTYKVLDIDYYTDPSEMWMARLVWVD
jgi:hypothetical protein